MESVPARASVAAEERRERGYRRRRERRRLTTERARLLVTDLEEVTIRELPVDLRRAVDLRLEGHENTNSTKSQIRFRVFALSWPALFSPSMCHTRLVP